MFKKSRLHLFPLILFVLIGFLPLNLEAQSQKILTNFGVEDLKALGPIVDVKVQSISPIDILFLGPISPNFLKIKIQPLKAEKDVDEILLTIRSPFEEILYKEKITDKSLWGNTFLKFEKDIIIPESGLMKDSILEAVLLRGGKKVGYSTKKIPEIKYHKAKFVLSDLKIKTLRTRGESKDHYEEIRVNFGGKILKNTLYKTKIEILDLKNSNKVISSEILKSKELKVGKKEIITHIFKEPLMTGSYEVQVQVLSAEEEKPLTGIIKKIFLVVGKEKSSFEVNIPELTFELSEDESQLEIFMQGVIDRIPENKLNLKLEYKQLKTKKEESSDDYKKITKNITITENWFDYGWKINIESEKKYLQGTISILNGDEILFSQKIDSPLPFKVKEIIKEVKIKKIEDNTINKIVKIDKSRNQWWPYIILLSIFLFMILFVYYFIKNKKKINNNILILLLGFGIFSFGGSVNANAETLQNFWYHPVVRWAYNPAATGDFELFKKIHFSGRAFDALNQKGAFQVDPTRIIVKFLKKGNTAVNFYVESLAFTIKEKRDYNFDIDTPPTMLEGEWLAEIYFVMDSVVYRSVWTDFAGNLRYLLIDKTPPHFLNDIKYDGEVLGPIHPILKPLESNLRRKHFKRKQLSSKKEANNQFLTEKRIQLKSKIRSWNQHVLELKDLKEALNNVNIAITSLTDSQGNIPQTLQINKQLLTTKIQNLETIILAEKIEIDTLKNELGENLNINLVSITNLLPLTYRPETTFTEVQIPTTINGTVTGCAAQQVIDPNNLNIVLSSDIDFTNVNFKDIKILVSDFTAGNYQNADFSTVDFTKASRNGTALTPSEVLNIDFSNVDFSNVDFAPAILTNGDFVDFTNVSFTGISLSGVDFTNIDFASQNFQNINFGSINLDSGFNATGCINHYESKISDLESTIQTQVSTIKQKKSRFKKDAIKINMVCDDNLSGCNQICSSSGDSCEINCSLNLAACNDFKQRSGHACPTVNGEEVCDINCKLYPESCRISDLSLPVKVNLCSDANHCDVTAARKYKICDNIGNCSTFENTALETDWYDPVSPELDEVEFIRNENNLGGTETKIDGVGLGDVLAVDNKINIKISAEDKVNPTYTDYPDKFENHACGGSDSAFYKTSKLVNGVTEYYCTPKQEPCAISSSLRGKRTQNGSCIANCPADLVDPNDPFSSISYLEQGGVCVPQCDHRSLRGCFPLIVQAGNNTNCTDSTWLPLEINIPTGEAFIQSSNCGHTRNSVGTSTEFYKFDVSHFNLGYYHNQ